MRLAVLADTHLTGNVEKRLPPSALQAILEADALLLAGDILSLGALREFESLAKATYAVLGNNDRELVGVLPERLCVELGGVEIAMLHDAGQRERRPEHVAALFPNAAVVVFGHSHVPCNELSAFGQVLFNPGSAMQRRAQPHHTIGILEVADGVVKEREIRIVS